MSIFSEVNLNYSYINSTQVLLNTIFCSNCGIYTQHQRRSDPTKYGYNIGYLEGVTPYDLGAIEVMGGVNHPADR